MNIIIEWPQGILIFFMALSVVTACAKHGEMREYNGPMSFIDLLITMSILYCGGFFS